MISNVALNRCLIVSLVSPLRYTTIYYFERCIEDCAQRGGVFARNVVCILSIAMEKHVEAQKTFLFDERNP